MIEQEPLGDRAGDLDQHREPPDRLGQPVRHWQFAAKDSGQGLWHERAGTRPLKVLGSSGHNSRARAMRADARLVASVYNPDNTSKRRDLPRVTQAGGVDGHSSAAETLAFLGRRAAMTDRLVLYEADDKVGVITLNRPEKLNAISAELQQQLTEAFARGDADPETSVVLLRAEGRSFCAGYDISAKEPGTDDWRSDPTRAHEHLRAQLDFEMVPWMM